MDQSIKRSPTKDDECYGVDDLDDAINAEVQELLENDTVDSFLLKGLEKSIEQSDLKSYECEAADGSDSIRRIKAINTPYRVEQKMAEPNKVSPIHVVPKKGGTTVVLNDNNALIPSNTVIGWRVCIDYQKLNDATRKDHFPLPFIDQMLERLCRNEYYCFLDGFSGFFQILIAPEDQEKTTFTCPYGTFAYRRMPCGLCNAPATFQRCMTAIFHDMVEDFMKVFMDDFVVFDNSFNCCLANLDRMLVRCEETNLVLNWEKCHFIIKEGIVLGHKISGARIEVDRARIDVIAKLPYPTNVKGNVPFELMCDASDFAIGAVLGQRIDGKFKPIYYANKTLNNAQEHYTTTKKELLTVVFSFDKFRPYLILSKTIIYTDHSALKYLFSKQDAKPRLIRLENPNSGTFAKEEIADKFTDEHLMILKTKFNEDEP
ncbi:reverse transcriptase domain-containing protein, partial [Tanacetum coccineum]